MAAGDVVADVFSAPPSSTTYFQPAAGVEVMITQVCYYSGGTNDCFLVLSDGVGTDPFLAVNSTTYTNDQVWKILINNSVYIGFNKQVGGAINVGYTGIQLK